MTELAARMALGMYAGEPCRICGREITIDDLETAVFAGYSEDNTSRSAHGTCWRNIKNIVRFAHQNGWLDRLLKEE